MANGRLPRIEDVERIDLAVVSLSVRSDEELRFHVLEPTAYPKYRPFDLVFSQPRLFTGADELYDVHFCARGPSADGDGLVFEFETREIVPTEGDPYQVEVAGPHGDRVLSGKAVHEIKVQIIAARATVESAAP